MTTIEREDRRERENLNTSEENEVFRRAKSRDEERRLTEGDDPKAKGVGTLESTVDQDRLTPGWDRVCVGT